MLSGNHNEVKTNYFFNKTTARPKHRNEEEHKEHKITESAILIKPT